MIKYMSLLLTVILGVSSFAQTGLTAKTTKTAESQTLNCTVDSFYDYQEAVWRLSSEDSRVCSIDDFRQTDDVTKVSCPENFVLVTDVTHFS